GRPRWDRRRCDRGRAAAGPGWHPRYRPGIQRCSYRCNTAARSKRTLLDCDRQAVAGGIADDNRDWNRIPFRCIGRHDEVQLIQAEIAGSQTREEWLNAVGASRDGVEVAETDERSRRDIRQRATGRRRSGGGGRRRLAETDGIKHERVASVRRSESGGRVAFVTA